LLVTVFLTIFLKELNEHGRDASKPAGILLRCTSVSHVMLIYTVAYESDDLPKGTDFSAEAQVIAFGQ
jgi:hypothetical protein